MQKWGEERIFPHPNIYYRTTKKRPSRRKASSVVSFVHHMLPLLVAMAMKETIEEKLDRFIHVGWRDKALQNSHGVGKINIAGHAFHVPHRFQKLVIDTALKDSPQLFHFTAEGERTRAQCFYQGTRSRTENNDESGLQT